MKSSLKISAMTLLTCAFWLSGCAVEDQNLNANESNQTELANNEANIALDDFVELGKIINLPFEPDESAVWREISPEVENPTPGGKKLLAVLKFTPEQTAEIIKNAEAHRASVPAQIDAESWFPVELIAQSQQAGDVSLKGNSYAADEFVKTPYIGGKLTRIVDTDYFVLELVAAL